VIDRLIDKLTRDYPYTTVVAVAWLTLVALIWSARGR
jgi:hypothetical protein